MPCRLGKRGSVLAVAGVSPCEEKCKRGDRLRIDPCVAPDWPGYELTYRHRSAIYHIVVENAAGTGRGVRAVTVDAHAVPDGEIRLMDDGKNHEVRVELG